MKLKISLEHRRFVFEQAGLGKTKEEILSHLKENMHPGHSEEEINKAYFPRMGFWCLKNVFGLPLEQARAECAKRLKYFSSTKYQARYARRRKLPEVSLTPAEVFRRKALQNVEYNELRQALLDAPRLTETGEKNRARMLETQLDLFVRLQQIRELARQNVPQHKIKRLLGLRLDTRVIGRLASGEKLPRLLDLEKLRAPPKPSAGFSFDVDMAALAGHYLSPMTRIKGGLLRLSVFPSELYRVKPVIGLLSKKLGKKVNLQKHGTKNDGKKQVGFIVTARELDSYLHEITGGQQRIPLELLQSKEQKLAFLNAFFHHYGSVFVGSKKGSYPKLILNLHSRRHLAFQLLPLLAEFDVFPNVQESEKYGFTRLRIEDDSELRKMVELKLLPQRKHDRLSSILLKHSESKGSYGVKDFESVHEQLAKHGSIARAARNTGVSDHTIPGWLRKIRPKPVKRYFRLYQKARELGLPFKEYPFTLAACQGKQSERTSELFESRLKGYRGRKTDKPGEIRKGGFADGEGERPIPVSSVEVDRVVDVRRAFQEASKKLTPSEKQALDLFLQGKKSDPTRLKQAKRKLQRNKLLRALYEEG